MTAKQHTKNLLIALTTGLLASFLVSYLGGICYTTYVPNKQPEDWFTNPLVITISITISFFVFLWSLIHLTKHGEKAKEATITELKYEEQSNPTT